MEIKKYRHACLVLTKNNESLVIDPGGWSDDFVVPENVVGVVVTHEHGDHFDLSKLREILAAHPSIYIYAHVDIVAQLGDLTERGVPVSVGEETQVGSFSLRFTGGTHATIHPDYPVCANLGVLVDGGELYYPGDSFALPGCAINTLAVPASAPWMKIAEAMDFITTVKPKTCFPTHNAILSEQGHALANNWLSKAAESAGSVFRSLD
jgi:L-ascorbate metabolism protein UlaG (beta-lactamase superfamily)